LNRLEAIKLLRKLGKVAVKPLDVGRLFLALLKKRYWRLRCHWFSRRFRIGKGFKVVGKFRPHGPGQLCLGHNVFSHGCPHPVTPFTHTPQAEIRTGNNVVLNGTRFGCSERIEVGDGCILADCRIFDTDMHSIWPNRRSDGARVANAPVRLRRNVWFGATAIILKDVTIGENSVVGAGSVVSRDVPPNVVARNPARVVKHVELNGGVAAVPSRPSR
jgi:acetyltransferase-like isoleucine patch superfamily enzyme